MLEDRVQIYKGNCLEQAKEIPDGSVDLLLTDIPYNISKPNRIHTMLGRTGLDFGDWDKGFDEDIIAELVTKVAKNGSAVIFHSMQQFGTVRTILERRGLEYKDFIVWHKTNPMPRNRDRRYINNAEIASWYTPIGAKWTFNRQSDTYDGCILSYPTESGSLYARYHPCQKNLRLMSELVCRHTNEGDTVYDPFMGSGTTGVASIDMGRKFIGAELDEGYYTTAEERIRQSIEERALLEHEIKINDTDWLQQVL